jgi:hypothetical protein
MATRMQQRRGTASQWTSANPVLNAGELGWESDTNKFKIGDGTNHWADLDYFIDSNSTVNPAFGTSIVFEGATADSYETTLQVTDPTADRTITLPDVTGTVITTGNLSDITNIGVFTSTITMEGATANDHELTISAGDPTADRTATFPDATGTIVLHDASQTLTNKTISFSNNAVSGTLAEFNTAVADADLVSISGAETLTNKTLTSPVVSQLILSDSSIVFEGSTANDYETTLTVVDPTEDRTITLPNETGTVITTGNFAAITSLTNPSISNPTISGLIISDSSIVLEGATANDFETTLNITDPTADRTITFPDISGNVITSGNLSDSTSLGVLSSIVFEGSTADDFELTLAGGEPTADRTVSFPDAGGVVVVDTATQTLTNKTLTSPQVSGLTITDGSIVLEGSTPNDFETTLTVTDPTADRTISFPDVTGTVVTTGDTGSVTSTMILDGTIVDGDINASAAIAQSKISGLTTDLGNKQDKISGVSDTEIGYLSAVTSDIQAQLDAKLALAGGTMTGAIAMGTSKITGLGTPTDAADAATKAYVDALGEGLHIHASVVAATTANITLATDVENGDTLDGVTLATGNRILVKNQSTASENGIYVVAASGAPSRAADFDSPAEIDGGDFVFVTGGTVNDNKGYVQINTVGTIGTDAIEFSQFSGAGTFTAGNGLTLTGPEFTINTSITADLSTAQTLTNKTLTSPKINLGINAQTGTNYTFVLADDGKFVTASNSSAITVTIPPISSVAYPIGAQLNIIQKGAGQVTFAQGAGVTINSTGATATAPKLRVRYSSATAVHEGSDIWYVVGDIA